MTVAPHDTASDADAGAGGTDRAAAGRGDTGPIDDGPIDDGPVDDGPGDDGTGPGGPARRTGWRALPFVLLAVLGFLGTQVSMLVTRPGWSFGQFRAYFPYDQLSYLAIVSEGSQGRFDFVEPFTRTGLDYYPHAYYLLLGLVAWVTGVSPLATWAAVGLVVQAGLVGVIGFATARLTGRAWTAVLAVAPFLLGTFAALRGPGWYTQLDGHAVLWGPFGVFFTLNGEAAGLAVGILGLVALTTVALRPVGTGRPLLLATVGAAAIGAVAGIQTYSFLTAVYVACYCAAVYGMVRRRSRVAPVLTVALLVLLFVLGNGARDALGPLALLVLGVGPALPGLVALLRVVGARLLVPVVALAVTAAPQVLWTARGIAVGEPFLLYRQDSSSTQDLGVPLGQFAVAGSILLVVLAGVFVVGLRRRHPLWTAFPVGAALAWFLVGANDRWGASQEPYRLWIDAFAVVAFVSVPVAASAAVAVLARRPAGSPARAGRGLQAFTAAWLVVVVALGVLSGGDWWRFWHDTRQTGFLTFYGAREDALAELTRGRTDDLLLTDPCLSPFDVKIATGGRVAFYNFGMAWPAAETPMRAALAARGEGRLDVADAVAAGVQTVVTSSSCPADWPTQDAADLRELATARYTDPQTGPVTLTLWELTP